MVGIGTVLEDDPLLTCRIDGGKNPARIVCDTQLRTPLDCQLVTTAGDVRTIIATCCDDAERIAGYEAAGCEVIVVARDVSGHVDLRALMGELGARSIDSVICEGGAQLNWAALEAGIVNKVQAYVAPKLFGGATAKTPVGGQGFAAPADAPILQDVTVTQLGDDYLIEGVVAAAPGGLGSASAEGEFRNGAVAANDEGEVR